MSAAPAGRPGAGTSGAAGTPGGAGSPDPDPRGTPSTPASPRTPASLDTPASSGTQRPPGTPPSPGTVPKASPASFHAMWRELAPLGRNDATGGYRRYAWTAADADCRAWFAEQAQGRGLAYEVDRNGNQWAWLGDPAAGDAVVTGSHLDSVPDGGAFDGPLGVVSAFAALDELRVRGARPRRPLAVVNFSDEEGARFGLSCVGSRLTTGQLAPDAARGLRDADGVTLARAMERAGHDPEAIGPDPGRLAAIGAFVELHIEQGRGLALHDSGRGAGGSGRSGRRTAAGTPVGVASAIWPHGRWRFDFRGEANHAGTTALADRRDPMLTYAATVLAAREQARLTGALATFGKVTVEPGGVNAIASLVRGWLDSRAPDETALAAVVTAVERAAAERGEHDGVGVRVTRESFTPVVEFEHALRDDLAKMLGGAPVLSTGAGHDAGMLSGAVPTAMMFVRNPTGISHSPAEQAGEDDCIAGITALADVLEGMACH